jgi:hypothetical protein
VRIEEDPEVDENLEASMGQYLKFEEEEIRCKMIESDQCFS